jgi:hypothetical protein
LISSVYQNQSNSLMILDVFSKESFHFAQVVSSSLIVIFVSTQRVLANRIN